MQHKEVSDTSKVSTGHKQLEEAEHEKDHGERNKPEHEDPIVQLEDMPNSPDKTAGMGKKLRRRKKKGNGKKVQPHNN